MSALTHIRILEVDEFIAKLWQVHLEVKREGYVQVGSLSPLFRQVWCSEFLRISLWVYSGQITWSTKILSMLHQLSNKLNSTQLPLPLVASLLRLQNCIGKFYSNILLLRIICSNAQVTKRLRYLSLTEYPLFENPLQHSDLNLPENDSIKGLSGGLYAAFKAYTKSETIHQCCVVFVVQNPERNIFDQRHLEYELRRNISSTPVFRLPFSEILSRTSIADTPKRELLYHLPHNPSKVFEVAVVYFRAGYGPGDYPDADAWKARLQIERSHAIKCPTILTQLSGAKKVQQVLATPTPPLTPSVLSRFLKSTPSAVGGIEQTFTNIFPLDSSPAGLSARILATDPQKCQSYVLKPQREGGGNNIYRSAIPPFLKSLPETHWKSYILMEIITPPPVHNIILRNGVVEKGGVICELGIYGTCLWDQVSGEVLHNEEAGHLLRTKGDKSEEGGVAAGFGSMDSCRLV